jgi:hypothetical protein
MAVYPDAKVDVTERGLLLKPSAPPVPERRPRRLTLIARSPSDPPAQEPKRIADGG